MNEENVTQAELKVSPSRALQCATSGRTLAVFTREGIKCFCRSCNFAHMFSWAELEQVRRELSQERTR